MVTIVKEVVMPFPRKRIVVVFLSALGILIGFGACIWQRQKMTQPKLADIMTIIDKENPRGYRFTLPVMEGERVVGTKVFGAMPLERVERIASQRGIAISPESQLHVIIVGDGDDGGGGGGGGGGGDDTGHSMCGAQAHVERIEQLRELVKDLDEQQYQLIFE
jgi:hypothetical protein